MRNDMKKKIIFIHNALWIGGIETALVSILNRIDYDRYDVTCLITSDNQQMSKNIPKVCKLIFADRYHTVSFSSPYKFAKLFGFIDACNYSTGIKTIKNRIARFFFRNLEEWLYGRYIARNLSDTHFDTAVIYSSKVAGLTLRSVTADNYISFYHYSDLRRVYHDNFGYDASSHIFAVSKNMADRLKEFMPKYRSKISEIHNLVDAERIRNKSKETQDLFAKDSFNIVSCGRLVDDKGFDLAINACRILTQSGFNRIQWYIIGEGPDKVKLCNLISAENLDETVHMVGVKANPYPYIGQADLFVQSSRIESFGLTITEALVLEVPVISTKTDGGREIITDGVNGVLCDTSAESIADAIKRVISDDDFRKRLSENAAKIDFEAQNNEILNRLYEVL